MGLSIREIRAYARKLYDEKGKYNTFVFLALDEKFLQPLRPKMFRLGELLGLHSTINGWRFIRGLETMSVREIKVLMRRKRNKKLFLKRLRRAVNLHLRFYKILYAIQDIPWKESRKDQSVQNILKIKRWLEKQKI